MKARRTSTHYFLRMSVEEWQHLVTVLNWKDYSAWLDERGYYAAAKTALSLGKLASEAITALGARQPSGPFGPVTLRIDNWLFRELLSRIDWKKLGERHREKGHLRWASICDAFERLRPLSYTGEQILAFLRRSRGRPGLAQIEDETPKDRRRARGLKRALAIRP